MKVRLTKTQRDLLRTAVGPVMSCRGTGYRVGGGYFIADNPRSLRALVLAGLATKASDFDRHAGWITDAGRAAVSEK